MDTHDDGAIRQISGNPQRAHWGTDAHPTDRASGKDARILMIGMANRLRQDGAHVIAMQDGQLRTAPIRITPPSITFAAADEFVLRMHENLVSTAGLALHWRLVGGISMEYGIVHELIPHAFVERVIAAGFDGWRANFLGPANTIRATWPTVCGCVERDLRRIIEYMAKTRVPLERAA